MLNNCPWYLRGQNFHLERWIEEFRECNRISLLTLWVQIPRLPVQFREPFIIKNITQPIGWLVRVDDGSINALNSMSIRVLMEIDVLLLMKMVLVVDGDDEAPTFVSYEKLFKVCIYCKRHTVDAYGCDEEDDDVSWFMINRLFDDEPKVVSEEVKDDCGRPEKGCNALLP